MVEGRSAEVRERHVSTPVSEADEREEPVSGSSDAPGQCLNQGWIEDGSRTVDAGQFAVTQAGGSFSAWVTGYSRQANSCPIHLRRGGGLISARIDSSDVEQGADTR